jgi:hypothetical protein
VEHVGGFIDMRVCLPDWVQTGEHKGPDSFKVVIPAHFVLYMMSADAPPILGFRQTGTAP